MEDHAAVFDTAGTALTEFRRALPTGLAHLLPGGEQMLRALWVCTEQGVDLAELAEKCARGLEWRDAADVRRLLLYRVCREAGLADELIQGVVG